MIKYFFSSLLLLSIVAKGRQFNQSDGAMGPRLVKHFSHSDRIRYDGFGKKDLLVLGLRHIENGAILRAAEIIPSI